MKAPPRPPAFQGGLWNITFDAAKRLAVVETAIPSVDFTRFLQDVGLPAHFDDREAQWNDGTLRPLMILACRAPNYPETETDVMAEAAIAFLEQSLAEGTLSLTPALACLFDALHARLDGSAIHIMPKAGDDRRTEGAAS